MSTFHFLLAAAWFLLWILTFHTGFGVAGRFLRRRGTRTEAVRRRDAPGGPPDKH
ncbi:hypothetical protein [Yinghuangia soli]|uniref:Uncharacterized protein n=1 Tax=Yinghuangia soli TaxID=2908204 RepID=A0AA41TY32_9ACTN|nr:hypothetical protein [Yinghuangia soli]MCF2525961.1 hypothetical protein [Yinghuangia soli]